MNESNQSSQSSLPLSIELGSVEIARFSGSEKALMSAPECLLRDIALTRIWLECPQARASIIKIDMILQERAKKAQAQASKPQSTAGVFSKFFSKE